MGGSAPGWGAGCPAHPAVCSSIQTAGDCPLCSPPGPHQRRLGGRAFFTLAPPRSGPPVVTRVWRAHSLAAVTWAWAGESRPQDFSPRSDFAPSAAQREPWGPEPAHQCSLLGIISEAPKCPAPFPETQVPWCGVGSPEQSPGHLGPEPGPRPPGGGCPRGLPHPIRVTAGSGPPPGRAGHVRPQGALEAGATAPVGVAAPPL